MTTSNDVIRLHRLYPKFSAVEIARRLNCLPEYVRATGRRRGLTFAKAHKKREPEPDTLIQLGRAARWAGLTVADIEAMGRKR